MSTEQTPVDDALAVIRRHFGPKVAALLTTTEQQTATVEIFQQLAAHEDEATARAWMIGQNPQLDDSAPILAIADGRTPEAQGAARAYLNGVWT